MPVKYCALKSYIFLTLLTLLPVTNLLAISLHDAAKKGDIVLIQKALGSGESINSKNVAGDTALLIAAKSGHLAVVKLLLEKGADIRVRNKRHKTALHLAVESRHFKVIKLLLAKAGDPKGSGKNFSVPYIDLKGWNDDTALHTAVLMGRVKIIKFLLSNGANIEALAYHKTTALHYAVRYKLFEISKLLILKGANISARNWEGKTALHMVVRLGKLKLVRYLLTKGADINARDNNGRTALYWAVTSRRINSVKLLLAKGANIKLTTKEGTTVLQVAAVSGDIRMAKFLLAKDADIYARDQEGNTVLHYAANLGKTKMVAFLLDKGSNIDSKNNYGRTAADDAALIGHGATHLYLSKRAKATNAKAKKVKTKNVKSKRNRRVGAPKDCSKGSEKCRKLASLHRQKTVHPSNQKELSSKNIRSVITKTISQFGDYVNASTCGLAFTYAKITSGQWKISEQAAQIQLKEIAETSKPKKTLKEMSKFRYSNELYNHGILLKRSDQYKAPFERGRNAVKSELLRNNFLTAINSGDIKAKEYLKKNNSHFSQTDCDNLLFVNKHRGKTGSDQRISLRRYNDEQLTPSQIKNAKKIYHYTLIKVFHNHCVDTGKCKSKLSDIN